MAGIAYVRELPPGQRPEVFWASAPDAFEVLARDKLLANVASLRNPQIPDKIGSFPVNDPSGFYLGQALAGYGIMYNTRYLKANKLQAPTAWTDLLGPQWFGHVGITAPSRSGTMHLTVETILQAEGWDKGWNTLLRTLAGNRKDAEANRAITQVESDWNTRARERYERARDLALQAAK